MSKFDSKYEKISFRVSIGEKNQLQRMARLSGKSLAQYIRDAAFSSPQGTTKIEFYQNIIDDLAYLKEKSEQLSRDSIYLKKYQYVISRTLFVLGSDKFNTQEKEKFKEFFKNCLAEAEKKFQKG